MTREQVKAALPILQAFSEGKKIQYRCINGEWNNTDKPDPYAVAAHPEHWRIKPKPREFWMVQSACNPDRYILQISKPPTVDSIHVREVID